MTLDGLKNILDTQGLTLTDLGTLLICYDNGDKINFVLSRGKLKKMKLLSVQNYTYVPANDTENIINSWLNETNYIRSEKERFLELADKLRELYPKGLKPGTNHMWRDSCLVIAKKLKNLNDNFQSFTDKEAIEATKKYVESFNGNYQYMQLLKYFILKRDLIKKEETSQLLSFIENKDTTINYEIGELV